MTTFKDLNISDDIIAGLAVENIVEPTSIQKEAIALALENKDLIAEAITGSGKTLAYVLPAFERIDVNSKELHTIILAPTHELVVQINNVIKALAKNSGRAVRSTTIIGQVNIKRQVEALKKKPHIIVGTPGRILELIKMKKLKAHQTKTIVIDEADKMLSDSNIQSVKDVIKPTLRERQIMVFSASIPQDSVNRAVEIMKDPTLVNITEEKINSDIEHLCVVAERRDKIDVLRKLIHATKPKKTIVFINRNERIQEVALKLTHHKIKAVGIYGNSTKAERKAMLDAFRSGKATVLVASDLVARGLDLRDITHVINLDIPENLNEYTHRAGRTGRAGKSGTAITIVTDREIATLIQIQNLTGIEFEAKEVREGKLVEPVQED